MWQEIAVGIVVAASALYVGWRIFKIYRTVQKEEVTCSCDCSQCGQTDDPHSCCQQLPERTSPR
jgi:hypothetical protein